MDSTLNSAALALSNGDLLGALNRLALRDDPDALAMRGIAMAQLGELPRARELLGAAAKGFAPDSVARARCVLAEAEIALGSRDLMWATENLEAAGRTLLKRGDVMNAAHASIVAARRHLLVGHLDLAAGRLADLGALALSPALSASKDLVLAGIEIRRLHATTARSALARAEHAANRSGIVALVAEVADAQRSLDEPAALLHHSGRTRPIALDGVETLLSSNVLVVDATRNAIRSGAMTPISLSSRPVLMSLAVVLAEAWPDAASREMLLSKVFGARHADESHRTRLRVEISRLRKLLAPVAKISMAHGGFRLVRKTGDVAILTHPMGGQDAHIMALLADGELWASSALAMVLGLSTRSVQRSLQALQEAGKIQSVGRARSLRWTVLTSPGFPVSLLLPGVA